MTDAKISQLENLSKYCADIGAKAEIDAQIAYHASRIGNFDLARKIIARVRTESGLGYPPSVAIWIIIADGILAFFENLDAKSFDRFRRANLLSKALNLSDLCALSAAWLAHSYFGRCQYDSMVKYINECLAYNCVGENSASSRVGLVLGNAYLYAGDLEKARVWYESARKSAVLDGDRATLGAIIYNRAAIALARYRADRCFSLVHALDVDMLSSAVLSASSFQDLTSNRALSPLLRMCEARLAIVEGRFDSAIAIFDGIRHAASISLSGATDEFFELEYMYCLVRVGRIEKANFLSCAIGVDSALALDCDDRVVFLFELLAIYKDLSIQHLITNTARLLEQACCAYLDDANRLRTQLQGVVWSEKL